MYIADKVVILSEEDITEALQHYKAKNRILLSPNGKLSRKEKVRAFREYLQREVAMWENCDRTMRVATAEGIAVCWLQKWKAAENNPKITLTSLSLRRVS